MSFGEIPSADIPIDWSKKYFVDLVRITVFDLKFGNQAFDSSIINNSFNLSIYFLINFSEYFIPIELFMSSEIVLNDTCDPIFLEYDFNNAFIKSLLL